MTDLSIIAKNATTAAAHSEELAASIDAEREAETAVLCAAIDAARPALRAICSRLKSRDVDTCLGTDRQRGSVDYHAERGVHLAGDDKGSRDCPRDDSGEYDGLGLYLLADGSLATRTWSGTWTKWQGGTDDLVSALTPITARKAMDEWELTDCLENLGTALEKAAKGTAPERSAKARARAEKLRALLALSK